jgi:hypothetical protein
MASVALGQNAKPPPQAEWDKATADITGSGSAAQDAAVVKVKAWIAGGWVSMDLWRKWIPALVKAGKNDTVAQLAFSGLLNRPNPEAIIPLSELRARALIAQEKWEEALAAAKLYYNVCDMKNTGKAVEIMAPLEARVHADQPGIAQRLRNEMGVNGGQVVSTAPQPGAATRGGSLYGAIMLDGKPFEAPLKIFKAKDSRFQDKMAYGYLLLAADKPVEAELVFRELYQTEATVEEVTAGTQVIAKALRNQDGNVGRALAFLATVVPTTAPAAAPKDLP